MPEQAPSRYTRFPQWPIRTLPSFDRLTKGQEFAPRIELVVGRDGFSAGISITAYLVKESGQPVAQVLFKHRWQDKPQSFQECLEIAYRGLSAYFEEAGIALP